MRGRNYTALTAMGTKFANFTIQLQQSNVNNLETLILYSRIDSVKKALIKSMGVNDREFAKIVAHAESLLGKQSESLSPVSDSALQAFNFGVRVKKAWLKRRYEAFVHPAAFSVSTPLPTGIKHIDRMQPIRSQGDRGTCVAFGTVAAAEFVHNAQGRLSEQFTYWAAKQRDDAMNIDGTTVEAGFLALKEAGICPDRYWPYNPNVDHSSVHQGPPPDEARVEARNLTINGFTDVTFAGIDGMKAILCGSDSTLPAIIAGGFLVYNSWLKNRYVLETGEISMPVPGEEATGGHCMAIVGYMDNQDAVRYPGGGYFIVRNSWGTGWGEQSNDSPGYGRIPYDFINQRHMLEAYVAGVSNQIDIKGSNETSGDRLSGLRAKLNSRSRW